MHHNLLFFGKRFLFSSLDLYPNQRSLASFKSFSSSWPHGGWPMGCSVASIEMIAPRFHREFWQAYANIHFHLEESHIQHPSAPNKWFRHWFSQEKPHQTAWAVLNGLVTRKSQALPSSKSASKASMTFVESWDLERCSTASNSRGPMGPPNHWIPHRNHGVLNWIYSVGILIEEMMVLQLWGKKRW